MKQSSSGKKHSLSEKDLYLFQSVTSNHQNITIAFKLFLPQGWREWQQPQQIAPRNWIEIEHAYEILKKKAAAKKPSPTLTTYSTTHHHLSSPK